MVQHAENACARRFIERGEKIDKCAWPSSLTPKVHAALQFLSKDKPRSSAVPKSCLKMDVAVAIVCLPRQGLPAACQER